VSASNLPAGFPRIVPHLIYDDVDAAIDWLTEAFGFRERVAARHTEADGKTGRAQMEVLDSLVTIGRPSIHGDSPRGGVSSMLYVYVDDIDGHYEHAKAAGATIVTQPHVHAGDRRYQAADPEGHQWTFAQHLPRG
jgi:PhnB protein